VQASVDESEVPKPRVLTPTPGSGEQKMTKDEVSSANPTTQSETQNRKNRGFQSEQTINHDDSLEKILERKSGDRAPRTS